MATRPWSSVTEDAAPALHCEIAVTGMQILAPIGAHRHERGRLQPLVLEIRLTIEPPECDALAAAFDYHRVAALAERVAERHVVLIETFARELAASLLLERHVVAAEVRVEKRWALANGVASARVAMRR